MKKLMVVVVIILIILGIGALLFLGSNKENNEKYNGEIESFEYSYGSFHGERQYKIYKENGKTYILAKGLNGINLELEKEIDENVLKNISKIVRENKIYEWNKFNKRDNSIMDGSSFTLKIKYTNGEEINAEGYMKYPKNYENGHEKLSKYLEEIN